MRRLRHVGALAGSACVVLAGVLAGGGPASAAPASPHPQVTAVPHSNTATTTTLGLENVDSPNDPGEIEFGLESALTAAFRVRLSSDLTPVDGGLADLRTVVNGTQIDLCSNVPISTAGTGTCTLSDQQLRPGSYQFIGHYEGVLGRFTHSDSAPTTVIVDPESTSITLTGDSSVFFGEETAGNYLLAVTPQFSGTPTGQVRVTIGAEGCTGMLTGGNAECHLFGNTNLLPGTYQLVGDYGGDGTFDVSEADETFAVLPGRAPTSLSVSQARIGSGQQQNEQLTARVAPVNAGLPTGTVKFMAGGSTICPDQPLASGTVTCNLAPGQLTVGRHQLTAVYSGDSLFASTTSAAATLTVTSPTTTSLALSTARVKVGREGAERLTVKVKPAITGSGIPRGKVTVKAGTTTLCVISLNNATGSCRLGPRKLRPGTYHLTARYAGAGLFTASTSPRKTLTVTR